MGWDGGVHLSCLGLRNSAVSEGILVCVAYSGVSCRILSAARCVLAVRMRFIGKRVSFFGGVKTPRANGFLSA